LVWAVYSFRAENREKIEREVTRLRDTLGPEVHKLYENALRDGNEREVSHLRDVGKKLVREAEETLNARAERLLAGSARDRVEIQDKLKAADNRLRDLSGLNQQAGRVRQSAADARQALERAARDVIRSCSGQWSGNTGKGTGSYKIRAYARPFSLTGPDVRSKPS
jgi:DNA repair ATPase RecN